MNPICKRARISQETTPIGVLPDELLEHTAAYLNPISCFNLSLVNRKFQTLVANDHFYWEEHLDNLFKPPVVGSVEHAYTPNLIKLLDAHPMKRYRTVMEYLSLEKTFVQELFSEDEAKTIRPIRSDIEKIDLLDRDTYQTFYQVISNTKLPKYRVALKVIGSFAVNRLLRKNNELSNRRAKEIRDLLELQFNLSIIAFLLFAKFNHEVPKESYIEAEQTAFDGYEVSKTVHSLLIIVDFKLVMASSNHFKENGQQILLEAEKHAYKARTMDPDVPATHSILGKVKFELATKYLSGNMRREKLLEAEQIFLTHTLHEFFEHFETVYYLGALQVILAEEFLSGEEARQKLLEARVYLDEAARYLPNGVKAATLLERVNKTLSLSPSDLLDD